MTGDAFANARLAALRTDLFVALGATTVANMSRACAGRLQDFGGTVPSLVAHAPVKNMDEAGFRIGGEARPRGRETRTRAAPDGTQSAARLDTRKENRLRAFCVIRRFASPATNPNTDGLMVKLRQRVFGGFRSMEGGGLCGHPPSIAAAKTQGRRAIEALSGDPRLLAKSLRP